MTTLTFTYPASVPPPLACDCRGAAVFLRFKPEWAQLTRDGHGVAHAVLQSRRQLADGTWAYDFAVHEPDLISPVPSIGGGMIQSICCEGCVGYAAEALHVNEFGGRLVAADDALTEGGIFVRHLIRPFRVVDVRAWIDTAAEGSVALRLIVDGQDVMGTGITIPAGELVSGSDFTFGGAASTGGPLLIPENALLELEVAATGSINGPYGITPAAKGLELWCYGHLNPGPYLLPT